MIIKTAKGDTIVSGRAIKDAKIADVNTKKGPIQKAQIAVSFGKEDGEVISVVAWRELASYASGIKKGDKVFACGQYSEHDYNGKKYKNVDADFMNYVRSGTNAASAEKDEDGFSDIDSSDIPF